MIHASGVHASTSGDAGRLHRGRQVRLVELCTGETDGQPDRVLRKADVAGAPDDPGGHLQVGGGLSPNRGATGRCQPIPSPIEGCRA